MADASVFRELGEDFDGPMEIESMCMVCEETGLTRLLLVNIPFFREVIVSAFECPHCHNSNNEIKQASQLQTHGCIIALHITSKDDMNRSLVKMETASVRFDEIDFEIPANTQPGLFTTIEGILSRAINGLVQQQPLRKYQTPEVFQAIEVVVDQLTKIREGTFPITLLLNDPTGNSYIENPNAPSKDPNMKFTYYKRSSDHQIDLNESSNVEEGEAGHPEEVACFSSPCPSCSKEGMVKMHPIDIPHFKEVIIMAFACDFCGIKSNEVRSGGGIPPLAKKQTLTVKSIKDFNREVVKSETCTVIIPELQLEVNSGSRGGNFTTVEGVLTEIKTDLANTSFCSGDSSTSKQAAASADFFSKLQDVLDLKHDFTLILDDPLGNSYIQNLYAPDPDPFLRVVEYERSKEQNDDLGLTYMNTEDYNDDKIKNEC